MFSLTTIDSCFVAKGNITENQTKYGCDFFVVDKLMVTMMQIGLEIM